MARESQTGDAAVGQPSSRCAKDVAAHALWDTARDGVSAAWRWLQKIAALVWTFLHDRVFLPSTIFLLGAYTAAEKFYISKKHSLMCNCHQMTAALARIKGRRLTGVALLAVLVAVLFSTAFYSFGIEVIVDGESLGYVLSQEDYQEHVNSVQSRVSEIMGRPCSVNPEVTFSFGIVERDKLLEGEKLESVLFSQIDGISELYALTVDGQIIGACQDRESVEQALAQLTASSDPNIHRELLSEISITHEAVSSSYLCSADELRTRLGGTKSTHERHVLQSGETVRSLCAQYNMKESELRALNPGLDPSALIAGQELIVNVSAPLLSVKEIRRVTESVSIPFTKREIKDSSLYVGKKSIRTNGVAGTKQVVSSVTYVDGKETGRTVLSETVMKQPVMQVVMVGTKPVPKKAATGTFRRPTSGAVISSNYGYRRSGFHTGVDFAVSYGSPVVAADGGTVSFAGWKGGYGYLVIISHGNGLQTYYGHNSRLLVSSGDRVAKGEQIAKIGSTGNSTGPHCHFEVRLNGRHVNPWRYIS